MLVSVHLFEAPGLLFFVPSSIQDLRFFSETAKVLYPDYVTTQAFQEKFFNTMMTSNAYQKDRSLSVGSSRIQNSAQERRCLATDQGLWKEKGMREKNRRPVALSGWATMGPRRWKMSCTRGNYRISKKSSDSAHPAHPQSWKMGSICLPRRNLMLKACPASAPGVDVLEAVGCRLRGTGSPKSEHRQRLLLEGQQQHP